MRKIGDGNKSTMNEKKKHVYLMKRENNQQRLIETKHAFFYDSHYKPFHQLKLFAYLVEIRAYAPICVPDENEKKTG